MRIFRAPKVLTLHLKRFSAGVSKFPFFRSGKLEKFIDFPLQFSLSPFMTSQDSKIIYDLCGVVIHSGGSLSGGHYYACVKNSSGVWYEMNDSSCRQIGVQQVLSKQ